jgi:alkylation response protein AidB-like acyl-CoA dehydrogenase
MQNELLATTTEGAKLVALATSLAGEFSPKVATYDRDGSYPYEHLEALKESGYLCAALPVEAGGLGVTSAHDVLVAASRLARGDAALSIGANMHVVVALGIARQWRIANRLGKPAAEALLQSMNAMRTSGMVIAAAISEPNQDLTRPNTVAARTATGWSISGTKIFATMSPAATHLNIGLRYTNEHGEERYGFALVPSNASGVTLNDDWDALGMRSSGSGSITLRDVAIAPGDLRDAFPAGEWSTPMIERYLTSGSFHASASLGIAEAAHSLALANVRKRMDAGPAREDDQVTIQHRVAESEIELAAMRAVFARSALQIEDYFAESEFGSSAPTDAHQVMAAVQSAKVFVCEGAVRVVDRAMTVSGGSAYMNGNALSRMYRDVRAGPFMHPLASNSAYGYIAKTALAA